MRKITQSAVEAFNNDKNFKQSNMQVTTWVSPDGKTRETRMLLHGNCIATKINGQLEITNCGWFTPTTKERLNGLPGVEIYSSKGDWFLNGEEWDGNWKAV